MSGCQLAFRSFCVSHEGRGRFVGCVSLASEGNCRMAPLLCQPANLLSLIVRVTVPRGHSSSPSSFDLCKRKSSSLQEFILGSQEWHHLALVACGLLISVYLNYLYLIYSHTLILIMTVNQPPCRLLPVFCSGLWSSVDCPTLDHPCFNKVARDDTAPVAGKSLRKAASRWRSVQSSSLNVVSQARLRSIALQFSDTLGSLVSVVLT